MRRPDAARERLRKAWQRHAGQWLAGSGDWPLRVALDAPGERKAMQAWADFQAWRDAWQDWRGPGEVCWAERQWSSLGTQALPTAWRLHDATEVATAVGELARWQTAQGRYQEAISTWPMLADDLGAQFDWLADVEPAHWQRLHDMLVWLQAHPASGLFMRQLPVAGADTKWLEGHAGRLGRWLRQIHDTDAATDFWQLSGLRREPDRLRLRLLDPALRAVAGGLGDIQAPFADIARLALPVRHVLIVENKQTGLACADLPGTALIMARGYAIDRLHTLPWLRAADHVHYWGDIDTHGLAILGRLRAHLPQARSLLMDEATLKAHRTLWVSEATPHAADHIDHLTAAEQSLYRDLKQDRFGTRVRLEQERIDWSLAWQILQQACSGSARHDA